MHAEKDVQQVLVNGLFSDVPRLFRRRLRQRWRMTSATSRRRAAQWRNPPPRALRNPVRPPSRLNLPESAPFGLRQIASERIGY